MLSYLIGLSLLIVLAFGYINQHRGGGPFRINNFLKDKLGFDLGRSLFTATLLLIPVLFGATLLFPHDLDWMWVAGTATGWLIWALNGWGSYFDNGTWEKEYNDKPEIPWIDWVLLKLFGPKWNPVGSTKPNRDKVKWDIKEHGLPFAFALGFVAPDLVKSPTGEIRPFSWRRKRDTVGLFLRHLHSIAFFGFQAWYFLNPWIALMAIPFALITTAIYYVSNIPSVDNWIRTKIPPVFENHKYWVLKADPNSYAEIATGVVWGICLLATLVIGIL